MMKLQHVAFWTRDIEAVTDFYERHFQATTLFEHRDGDFRSRFLSLGRCVRIELMSRPGLAEARGNDLVGYSHLSLDVGSAAEVDRWTAYFLQQGVALEKQQVQYDDGYYETSIFDPDGNIIELAHVDSTVNPDAQRL